MVFLVVKPDIAEVFSRVEKPVAEGRKIYFRVKKKSMIMTGGDMTKDLDDHISQ